MFIIIQIKNYSWLSCNCLYGTYVVGTLWIFTFQLKFAEWIIGYIHFDLSFRFRIKLSDSALNGTHIKIWFFVVKTVTVLRDLHFTVKLYFGEELISFVIVGFQFFE